LSFLHQTWAIASKDLQMEVRSKETVNAALSFSLVILLLFSFAFDPTSEETRLFAGGLLWLAFAFAGAMILNRSFSREQPNDCLDALVASPVSAPALFAGKSVANFVMLMAVETVSLPIFGIFYNITWTTYPWDLAIVIALSTWGLTVVGTVFSALTVNLRLREIMLPMLVYPISIPVLMSAMRLTNVLMTGQGIAGDDWIWFRLLIGFDIIFTALAVSTVDSILVG
jgi:heme exporter protein B